MIHAPREGRIVASLAGGIFNLISGDESDAGTNQLAVEIGYDFASSGALNNTSFNREQFCSALTGLGNGWRD